MRTVRTIAEVRAELPGHGTVALVPTMGGFHDGHLSLIRAARATADLVVVWLFVNPRQFNEATDLAAYPRDEQRDAWLAEQCGADVLFVPDVAEVYPSGFATTVSVSGVGEVLKAHRPRPFLRRGHRRSQDAQHAHPRRRRASSRRRLNATSLSLGTT